MSSILADGQFSVVARTDLQRIQSNLGRSNLSLTEDQARRQGEREYLHKLSQERVKNWGNTIEAQRRKKEEGRRKKLEEEEEKRRKIDEEEERFRDEQRRKAIERANRILYEQNDKIKAFNSRLLLSDVLKERELQLTYKQIREEMNKEREQEWAEEQSRQLEEWKLQEKKKKEMELQKAMEVKKIQDSQFKEIEGNLIKEIEDEKLEGEMIKRRTEMELAAEREAALKKKIQDRTTALEARKLNEELANTRRMNEQRRAEAEELMIATYAEEKARTILERKKREEEKENRKKEAQDRMRGYLATRLLELQESEAERLVAQEAEVELKKEEQDRARKEKERKTRAEMELSHAQQLRLKAIDHAVEREEDKFIAEQIKLRNAELLEEERQEKLNQIGRCMEVQGYHFKQMHVKEHRKKKESLEQLQEAEDLAFAQLEEEKRFKEYTQQALDKYASLGKSTKPMELEIKKKPLL